MSLQGWSLLVLTGSSRSLLWSGLPKSLQAFHFQDVYLRGPQFNGTPEGTGNKYIHWWETVATKYFYIALPTLFSLFRCTFTAVQMFARLQRATAVNHHASDGVRDEFIICKIQEQYALKSDHVFMSVCREKRRGCGPEDGWAKGCGFCWTCDNELPWTVDSSVEL